MPARKPPVIPAHETDVYRLLHGFEQRVAAGQLLGFATFKSLWQDMHFSHIFEGNATGALLHEQYIQSLFAAAADGLLHSPASLLSLAVQTDAADPAATAAAHVPCQRPADTPQGASPTANGSGHGPATTSSPALTQEQLAQLLDLSEDEDDEDVDVLGGSPPAPLLRSLAAGIAARGATAQLDGNGFGNGITGTTAAGRGGQGGAAADRTTSGARNGSRQKTGRKGRKGRHQHRQAAQQLPDTVQAPSHAGAAAAVFTLHCLHELQAAPQGGAAAGGGPRVRAYLPLPALRAAIKLLADLRRDGPPTAERDVAAALAAMRRDGAFVVGALCRPASGSAAYERAARAQPRAAAADITAEQALTREAKFFLNSTLEGLKGLQVVVGEAAPAYEAARDAVWQAAATAGGTAPPPPIANLGLGPWLRAENSRTMDGVKHALEGQGRKWLAAQRAAAGRSVSAALAASSAEAEPTSGQDSGLDDEIMASLAAADADTSDGDSGDPSIGGALAAAGLGGLGMSVAGLAELGGAGAQLRAATKSSRGSGRGGERGAGRARGGARGSGRGRGRSAAGDAAAAAERGGSRGNKPSGRGSGSRSSAMSAQQKAEARAAAERKRVTAAEAAWQQALHAAAQPAPSQGGSAAATTAATATSPRKRLAAASGAARPSGRRPKSARVTFEADAADKQDPAAAAVDSAGASSHAAAGSAQQHAPAAADSQAASAAGADWPDDSRVADLGGAKLSNGAAASAAGQRHRSSRDKKRSAERAAAKHPHNGVTKRSRLATGSSDARQSQAAAAAADAAPSKAQPAAERSPDGPAAGAVNVPNKKRRSNGGHGSQLHTASGGGSSGGIDAAAALAEHEALMAQVDAAMRSAEDSD